MVRVIDRQKDARFLQIFLAFYPCPEIYIHVISVNIAVKTNELETQRHTKVYK